MYFDKPGAFGCNATIDDVSFRLDRQSINKIDRARFDALINTNTEINEIQILSTEPRLSDISMPVEVLDTPLPDEFTDAYLTAFSDIQDSLESLSLHLQVVCPEDLMSLQNHQPQEERSVIFPENFLPLVPAVLQALPNSLKLLSKAHLISPLKI